jgi:hypothetical protein
MASETVERKGGLWVGLVAAWTVVQMAKRKVVHSVDWMVVLRVDGLVGK